MPTNDALTFTTLVELGSKTATGLEVPPDVIEQLDSGKRPAVSVTIGSYAYRTTVAVMSSRYFVPLAAEHRNAAGVAAGDTVEVAIALDTAPRIVELPDDLTAALAAAGLTEAFERLAYSHRKEHVRAVEDAKKPETRQRRIAKAVEALSR